MGRTLVLACTLLVGCVNDPTVPCGDIRCPAGTVCTASMACAYAEQLTACEGKDAHEACSALDFAEAACEDGICQPIVCGDGLRVGPEVCDDNNQRSGDGCAADCLSDETCGNETVDPLNHEDCDSGVAGLSSDGCTSRCTVEALVWDDITASAPIPTWTHAMVFDPTIGETVMFGGLSASTPLAATWTYDGRHWRHKHPPTEPLLRFRAAMARDDARNNVVMFGGVSEALLDETWTWDGITWTPHAPTTSPSARRAATMAFDPVHAEVVLFGGNDGSALGDTWIWDGATWIQRTPETSPPAGAWAMAWDATTQRVVLVEDAGAMPTTWTWDGTTWTSQGAIDQPFTEPFLPRLASIGARGVIATGLHPVALIYANGAWTPSSAVIAQRTDHGMAYDAIRDRVVVFGGHEHGTIQSPPTADTFEWDGTVWSATTPVVESPAEVARATYLPLRGATLAYDHNTWLWDGEAWDRLAPAHVPAPRGETAMVATRTGALMFGGASVVVRDDTWAWTGDDWLEYTPGTRPPARRNHAMAYDSTRDRVIMFGGEAGSQTFADTWAWDGATWTEIATPHRPPGRVDAAMAYDARRDRVVLYSGSDAVAHPYTDTWELVGDDWIESTVVSPPGRAGSAMVEHPLRHTLIMFGGYSTTGLLGFVWEYDGETWTQLMPIAPGVARTDHAMVFDARAARMITFGGAVASGQPMAVSALSFLSNSVPADACLDVDTDGDSLVGCDDPDCWARCTPLCAPATACDPTAPHCGDDACSVLEDRWLCPDDCP